MLRPATLTALTDAGVTVHHDVPLAALTTLRLGGPARTLLRCTTTDAVVAAVRACDDAGEPVLVLGGGSNLVVADEGFDGTVVHVATTGTQFDGVHVTVAAGVEWDPLVGATVRAGLGGLECLSGIPGSTGATPVQNVGAYGVEIADVLTGVQWLDRACGRVEWVDAATLELSYRSSSLKHTGDAVVLGVRFALTAGAVSAPVTYAELAAALGVAPGQRRPAADVRAAVLALRAGKGMVLDDDDPDTWSVGSFFTNPVLDAVPPAYQGPRYPAGGSCKLSAGWLIEHSGFTRGHPGPAASARLSTKHTLALTNRGHAATGDLLALAREVRAGVRSRFGVVLEPEPVLVGCRL